MIKLCRALAKFVLLAIFTMGIIVGMIGLIGLLWFLVCTIMVLSFDWMVPIAVAGIIFLCIGMTVRG